MGSMDSLYVCVAHSLNSAGFTMVIKFYLQIFHQKEFSSTNGNLKISQSLLSVHVYHFFALVFLRTVLSRVHTEEFIRPNFRPV